MQRIIKRTTIHGVAVIGDQSAGWKTRGTDSYLTDSRSVDFTLEISDDGAGFLLLAVSADGSLYCDTWYENIESALAVARDEFGATPSSWDMV